MQLKQSALAALALVVVAIPSWGGAEIWRPSPGFLEQDAALALARERLPRARAWHPSAIAALSAAGDLEYQRADASLTFDLQQHAVTVVTEITIQARTDYVDPLVFQPEPLASQTVVVEDEQGVLSSRLSGLSLEVIPRAPMSAGETLTLTVTQSGRVPPPQHEGDEEGPVTFVHIGEDYIFNFQTGWLVFLKDSGPRGFAQVSTFSLTLPLELSLAAAGLFQGAQSNTDGTVTHTYLGDKSTGFNLFNFLAAPFEMGETPFSGEGLARSFLSTDNAPYAEAWRQAAIDCWFFHEALYGELAFDRVDIAECPDVLGQVKGIAGQGISYVMGSFLGGAPPQPANMIVLAHELAHQWFGISIEVAQYCALWLGEGFATFAERQYMAKLAEPTCGKGFHTLLRRERNNRYVYGVLPTKDHPLTSCITAGASDILVPVSYAKGSLVLGLIQLLLGDEAFYAALRRYKEDHREQGATTESFFASLEASSGRSFEAFAQTWVYEAGYPTLTVAVEPADRSGAGPLPTVQITVTADRDPLVPIPLAIRTADGQLHLQTITLDSARQAVVPFDAPAPVVEVTVDPESVIPGRKLGALPGDVQVNGQVDGVDLIQVAWALHEPGATPMEQCLPGRGLELFPEWADIVFDGAIDDQDLDLVRGAFGQSAGE